MFRYRVVSCLALILTTVTVLHAQLQSADLYKLHAVGTIRFSPDGTHVAYVVDNFDRPGRAWAQVWIMNIANGQSLRLGAAENASSGPEWSPDGNWIAYHGEQGGKSGLLIAHPDGTGTRFLAETSATNAPLPYEGRSVSWSPDGKHIAFVSSTPGPETAEATGDPVVIRRYLYKPDCQRRSDVASTTTGACIFSSPMSPRGRCASLRIATPTSIPSIGRRKAMRLFSSPKPSPMPTSSTMTISSWCAFPTAIFGG